MGVPVRPGNKTLMFRMAHAGVPASEKSSDVKIQNQNHADCFFRPTWHGSQEVCAYWNDRKGCILHASTDTSAKSQNARVTSHCEELETSPWQHAVPRCDCYAAASGEIRHGNIASLPPYSPDLAPPDFFLFPQMKRALKGHQLDSIEAVQAATTKALNSIPEIDFQRTFDEWQTRRTKCDMQDECILKIIK